MNMVDSMSGYSNYESTPGAVVVNNLLFECGAGQTTNSCGDQASQGTYVKGLDLTGMAVIGIRGASGSALDGIQLVYAPLDSYAECKNNGCQTKILLDRRFYSPLIGGMGGLPLLSSGGSSVIYGSYNGATDPSEMLCPAASVLTGVKYRTNSYYVTAVSEIQCRGLTGIEEYVSVNEGKFPPPAMAPKK